jgi:hypothetical protein
MNIACDVPLIRDLLFGETCKRDPKRLLHFLAHNETLPLIFAFNKSWSLPGIFIRFFTRSGFTHVGFLHPMSIMLEKLIFIDALPSKNEVCYKKYAQKSAIFSIPWIRKALKFLDASWKFTDINDRNGQNVVFAKIELPAPNALVSIAFYEYLAISRRPYNYLGVIGFVLPIFVSNGGYFCSEGIWEGIRFSDARLSSIPGWKLSPDELLDQLRLFDGFEILYEDKIYKITEQKLLSTLSPYLDWYLDFVQAFDSNVEK